MSGPCWAPLLMCWWRTPGSAAGWGETNKNTYKHVVDQKILVPFYHHLTVWPYENHMQMLQKCTKHELPLFCLHPLVTHCSKYVNICCTKTEASQFLTVVNGWWLETLDKMWTSTLCSTYSPFYRNLCFSPNSWKMGVHDSFGAARKKERKFEFFFSCTVTAAADKTFSSLCSFSCCCPGFRWS